MEILLFKQTQKFTEGQMVAYQSVDGKYDAGTNTNWNVAPVEKIEGDYYIVDGRPYYADELKEVR